jgi:UDP-N-acetylglucosamine 2-epimerase (non-hydrolysing)
MAEVLSFYQDRIAASPILSVMQLAKRKYFVVSAHREENIDSPTSFTKLVGVLNALAQEYQLPVIVSCHPRTKKKFDEHQVVFHSAVQIMKPLGFHDYVKLQMDAKAVLSDSGTITEESSILGFPALNLREAHERPEGMEEAAVMMVGLEIERIKQGLSILEHQTQDTRPTGPVADYSALNVSEKVVRLIHSYTDYVNRVVWKKY